MAREFEVERSRTTLFKALLRARRLAGGKTPIIEDHERRVLSYDDLLRAIFAIAGKLKGMTSPKEPVGIMLPTGIAATVTFFALHAIGRTPVMLNFTAGAMNLKAACRTGRVRRILTANAFIEIAKLQPLIEDLAKDYAVTRLEDVRRSIGLADKLTAAAKALAPETFAPDGAADDPGVILFTSGSFGAPKGALISQANLVANVEQINAHIDLKPDWVFFNPLPMFHCFGLTGGTLLPLLTGRKVFQYPSPLHFKEIPSLIAQGGANILLATDTFACQYARSAKDGELSSLAFCVLGAERVRPETRELYKTKFGVELVEGYGVTEAAPVVAVNQPGETTNRPGTVGRMLPGIEVRLDEVPGIAEGRRLFVRGPNVMKGYLTADGELEEIVDGWHDTGDIVSVDDEGFVRILGRVKRFAKIGGEMVSLNAVEMFAAKVWPEHTHAAVAVKDPRKGERVVLISDAPHADPEPLMAWAKANGAPEIAIPKKVLKVPEIPVLGTGKTDYVSVQKLAEEALAQEARAA